MTNQYASWIGPMGLGVALMYLFDSSRGRRRRARLRDSAIHIARQTARGSGALTRDLQHRTEGLVAATGLRVAGAKVDDTVLDARVRSALGRASSHPGAIGVQCIDGIVTLTGPVLARDHGRVCRTVRRVSGVSEVIDQMTEHARSGSVPGLQGDSAPRGRWIQSSWSPTARLCAVGGGIGLVAIGVRKRTVISVAAAVAGAGLIARGVTNLEVRRIIGVRGRRAVDLQETIHVVAPVAQVFNFWRHFENFPRFMTHVREVQDLGDGRSRWTVDGPAGVPVHWDAVVTDLVLNERIAWKTVEGSPIAHAGIVRFDANENGTTRLTVQMTYNPLVGAIGHALALLLGSDPRRRMNDDLVRMKTALETGRPPQDAAQAGGAPAYL